MDVLVERFLRRKDVTNPDSQKLYYLRQKPKTCGTVDIAVSYTHLTLPTILRV